MARETPVRRAFVSAARQVGEAFRVRPEERAFEQKFTAQQAELDRPLTGRESEIFALLVDEGLRRNPKTAKLTEDQREDLTRRVALGTSTREYLRIKEILSQLSGGQAKFAAIEARVEAGRVRAAGKIKSLAQLRQEAIERNRSPSLAKARLVLGVRAGEDVKPVILSAFEILGAVDATARPGVRNPFPEISAFVSRVRALPDTPEGQRQAASIIDAALAAPAETIDENFGEEASDLRLILRGLADPELRRRTLGFFGKPRQRAF